MDLLNTLYTIMMPGSNRVLYSGTIFLRREQEFSHVSVSDFHLRHS